MLPDGWDELISLAAGFRWDHPARSHLLNRCRIFSPPSRTVSCATKPLTSYNRAPTHVYRGVSSNTRLSDWNFYANHFCCFRRPVPQRLHAVSVRHLSGKERALVPLRCCGMSARTYRHADA
eukprot:3712132-Pleurochrysis_carterae.AAC.1